MKNVFSLFNDYTNMLFLDRLLISFAEADEERKTFSEKNILTKKRNFEHVGKGNHWNDVLIKISI